MNDLMRTACVGLLAAAAATSACAQQSGYADAILGRWDLTIHGADGDYPSWLEIRLRTENQLMASFVGQVGSIYGFIAPSTDAARPAGEWQSSDIALIGRRISVSLNGTEIIANREIPGITGGALDSDEGRAGPLMLQGDHGPIEYRNIVITPAD